MQTPHMQMLLYATIFFVLKNENHGKSLAFIPLFFYGQSGQLWVCIGGRGQLFLGRNPGKGEWC